MGRNGLHLMLDSVSTRTLISALRDRARLYFSSWAKLGRDTTSSFSEQITEMMSTTEKVIDLDSIRQRLDRLGVRL
jgi:hypothetical protein